MRVRGPTTDQKSKTMAKKAVRVNKTGNDQPAVWWNQNNSQNGGSTYGRRQKNEEITNQTRVTTAAGMKNIGEAGIANETVDNAQSDSVQEEKTQKSGTSAPVRGSVRNSVCGAVGKICHRAASEPWWQFQAIRRRSGTE